MDEIEDSWTEKYRPKTLKDVIGNRDTIKRLETYIASGRFPHLLFTGPPGTGKTTSAYALAYDCFGNNADIVELNASEFGGINAVRNEIDKVISTASIKGQAIKVFILDESDRSSEDFQQGMRRKMETCSKYVKFIWIANDEAKVIGPIQDRCAVFRFKSIKTTLIFEQLISILDQENKLKYISHVSVQKVAEEANGSMRKAINRLESLIGHTSVPIEDREVDRLTLIYPEQKAKELLQIAVQKGFSPVLKILKNQQVSARMFFSMIAKEIQNKEYSEKEKVRMAKALVPFAYFNENFYVLAYLAGASKVGSD